MSAESNTHRAVERLLDQCEAQGFPRTVTDPATLERVAAIVATTKGGTDVAA